MSNDSFISRQCFVFHLYKGVRAGGGIGDEIEAPDGDEYELYRIIFDITFFFFIIVILLAIIQGKLGKNEINTMKVRYQVLYIYLSI